MRARPGHWNKAGRASAVVTMPARSDLTSVATKRPMAAPKVASTPSSTKG